MYPVIYYDGSVKYFEDFNEAAKYCYDLYERG